MTAEYCREGIRSRLAPFHTWWFVLLFITLIETDEVKTGRERAEWRVELLAATCGLTLALAFIGSLLWGIFDPYALFGAGFSYFTYSMLTRYVGVSVARPPNPAR